MEEPIDTTISPRKRRARLLDSTLERIMTEFSTRQEEMVNNFLPLVGVECKEMIDGHLSLAEKGFITREFHKLGYEIELKDEFGLIELWNDCRKIRETRSTCLKIVGYCSDVKYSTNVFSWGCVPAAKLKAVVDDHMLHWILSHLSRNEDDNEEIRIFIPLYFSNRFCLPIESEHCMMRFQRALHWANLRSSYKFELRDCRALCAIPKSSEELAKTQEIESILVFSSLMFIDRMPDEQALDWRYLPRTAMRIVFHYLVGRDVLK